MAWLELHQGIFRHRKVVRLAGRLGVHRLMAGAHVISLWLWALDNAPDGVLTRLTSAEIAVGAEWEQDPQTFVDAMVEAGLFDRTKKHLVIHDWVNYVGRLMELREANKARQKRFRDTKRNALRNGYVTGPSNANVTVTSRDTVPNPTVPNLTKEKSPPKESVSTPRPSGPRWLETLRTMRDWNLTVTPENEETLRAWAQEKAKPVDLLERVALAFAAKARHARQGEKPGPNIYQALQQGFQTWVNNDFGKPANARNNGHAAMRGAPDGSLGSSMEELEAAARKWSTP